MNLNLSAHDQDSLLWRKISSSLTRELNLCRAQNDNDMDEIRTAKKRGRIQLIKELLAAPTGPAQETTDP